MTLETNRLTLRPWHEEDAEALYSLACDPEVGPSAGWMPHMSVEHSREIIRTMLSKPTVWAVCGKDERPIGNVHFDFDTPLREHDGECELGYWLGKSFWGQGLMTEAAQVLLSYAFDVLDVPAVWSGYYDENIRSRRVQEKLGFVHHRTEKIPCVSNEIKTVHRTCLTREIWEERHEPSSI
ncbi:MAG: GNAT family N-acetyltransferase [Clostridia bacterium]|nr:GNAT family N-acetyltransferase [Clostridia bacterium]